MNFVKQIQQSGGAINNLVKALIALGVVGWGASNSFYTGLEIEDQKFFLFKRLKRTE